MTAELVLSDLTHPGAIVVEAGQCAQRFVAFGITAQNFLPHVFQDERLLFDQAGRDSLIFGLGWGRCLGTADRRLGPKETIHDLLRRADEGRLGEDSGDGGHLLPVGLLTSKNVRLQNDPVCGVNRATERVFVGQTQGGRVYEEIRGRRNGSFYLIGSRVPLALIVHEFKNGELPEAIRTYYPTLSLEQVDGAITF